MDEYKITFSSGLCTTSNVLVSKVVGDEEEPVGCITSLSLRWQSGSFWPLLEIEVFDKLSKDSMGIKFVKKVGIVTGIHCRE